MDRGRRAQLASLVKHVLSENRAFFNDRGQEVHFYFLCINHYGQKKIIERVLKDNVAFLSDT